MSFEIHDRLSEILLRKKGIIAVYKVARSGVTFSLVKKSVELGKKVVIFEPTRRILNHIESEIPKITKDPLKIGSISSNQQLCRKLDSSLKLKFQFKENCFNCEYRGKANACMLQNILLNDFDIIGLTYDKLRALQLSRSKESKSLLEKLRSCDVFILDEFTTVILSDIQTIKIVKVNENSDVEKLSDLLNELEQRTTEFKTPTVAVKPILWSFIKEFLNQFEKITTSDEYNNECIEILSKKDLTQIFRDGWRYIAELTALGVDTSNLQDIFLIVLTAERIVVECEDGNVTVTPVIEDALGYLRELCKGIAEDKPIFLIDSFQPKIPVEHIFGRKVEHALWGRRGDPIGTDRLQIIIPDTAHWGEYNFRRDSDLQLRVQYFIKELLDVFPPEKVLIVTTNKTMAKIISYWGLPKIVRITWHRSDWMRGVSVEDRRIFIGIGGSYLPKNAYMSAASSFNFENFFKKIESLSPKEQRIKLSKKLNIINTNSEFINAISRVKDPKAQERSVVFTLGMTERDVKLLLRQFPVLWMIPEGSRSKCVQHIRKGGLGRDGLWIATLWFNQERIRVEDLPIIARIIRIIHEKIYVRASEVLPRATKLVIEKAERYIDVLYKYNVEIIRKKGGVSFSRVDRNKLDRFL